MKVHSIPQGGDLLMPLLFCLGQHSAFECGRKIGRPLHVVCKPDMVGAVHDLFRVDLWDKCRISLHAGRPRCGTRVAPTHPIAPDWCGEGTPTCTLINRDSRCLEFLNGFLKRRLRTVCCSRRRALFCAAARSNFFLRAVNPSETNSRPWCVAVFVQDSVHCSKRNPPHTGQVGRTP